MRPVAILALVLSVPACGESSRINSATAPSVTPSASSRPAVAALVVSTVAVVKTRAGDYVNYVPRIRVTETTGLSGATIRGVAFGVPCAGANPFPFGSFRAVRVAPGETRDIIEYAYGDPSVEFSSRVDCDSATIEVPFIDDAGQAGSVIAATAISE